jgi:hypothetical protein
MQMTKTFFLKSKFLGMESFNDIFSYGIASFSLFVFNLLYYSIIINNFHPNQFIIIIIIIIII